MQMNEQDKRKVAIRLYAAGTGLSKTEIADTLSVSQRSVTSYLSDVDKQLREERKEKIFNLWMECNTLDEIAAQTGITTKSVDNYIEEFVNMEAVPNVQKVLSSFQDTDFTPPFFNVWTFAKRIAALVTHGTTMRTMDDTEALVQLIVGNIQTENKPLEIGLNALELVVSSSKQGLSAVDYGERVGIKDDTIRNYVNAAKVYRTVKEQNRSASVLLEEIAKLVEIGKCNQSDWTWLHDFILENELSHRDTIAICRTARVSTLNTTYCNIMLLSTT